MSFRKVLEDLITSFRFSSILRNQKKFRNPEIRELFEDFKQKKRTSTNTKLQQDSANLESMKNTYAYKCYEHSRMLDFYSNKTKSIDFIKYCKFPHYYIKERWTNSKFYFRYYHTPKDFEWSPFQLILLALLGLITFKIGYVNGFKDSTLYDTVKEEVVDIRTEDQLFDILVNQSKPVLVLYYVPGDFTSLEMQIAQGDFALKNKEVPITMAKVNCKYNVDLCLKKTHNMILPQWELMYPPVVK